MLGGYEAWKFESSIWQKLSASAAATLVHFTQKLEAGNYYAWFIEFNEFGWLDLIEVC